MNFIKKIIRINFYILYTIKKIKNTLYKFYIYFQKKLNNLIYSNIYYFIILSDFNKDKYFIIFLNNYNKYLKIKIIK